MGAKPLIHAVTEMDSLTVAVRYLTQLHLGDEEKPKSRKAKKNKDLKRRTRQSKEKLDFCLEIC